MKRSVRLVLVAGAVGVIAGCAQGRYEPILSTAAPAPTAKQWEFTCFPCGFPEGVGGDVPSRDNKLMPLGMSQVNAGWYSSALLELGNVTVLP